MEIESERAALPARVRRSFRRRVGLWFATFMLVYLAVAYVLVPLAWEQYTHRHVSLENVPGITHTKTGIPGDPLNVALIGTEHELKSIMLAAKWFPADPLTWRSCLHIADATVLKRPYDDAPVSNLYLFGRKEDLAFEQPVGHDPRKRQHVRFWLSDEAAPDGRPIYVGAATFDEKVGLSHTTGEITHHISADVDAERDQLFADLQATGDLSDVYLIADFHTVKQGKNGGGDRWHTDGGMEVGVITLASPGPVEAATATEASQSARIIGKWRAHNAARPIGRLPHAVFVKDLAEIAIDVISDGEDETEVFDMVEWIEIDFRADGTCVLNTRAENTDREGTWTLDGDTLVQSYRGKRGEPGAVAWEIDPGGPLAGETDRFTLSRPSGPTFVFVRAY